MEVSFFLKGLLQEIDINCRYLFCIVNNIRIKDNRGRLKGSC